MKDPEEKEGDKEKWLLELVWIIDSKNYYCKSKYLVHNKFNYHSFMESLKKYHHGHPILRKKPFSLLELAKNEIRNTGIKDEDISMLEIPKVIQTFLKER